MLYRYITFRHIFVQWNSAATPLWSSNAKTKMPSHNMLTTDVFYKTVVKCRLRSKSYFKMWKYTMACAFYIIQKYLKWTCWPSAEIKPIILYIMCSAFTALHDFRDSNSDEITFEMIMIAIIVYIFQIWNVCLTLNLRMENAGFYEFGVIQIRLQVGHCTIWWYHTAVRKKSFYAYTVDYKIYKNVDFVHV